MNTEISSTFETAKNAVKIRKRSFTSPTVQLKFVPEVSSGCFYTRPKSNAPLLYDGTVNRLK